MNTSIRDLETKGFVTFSYPPDLRKAVKVAMESWKDFYSLPTEVKKSLPYSNDGAGVGYELKVGGGPTDDRKENFDISGGGRAWLEQHITEIKNPVALQFVQDALAVAELAKPLIFDFARQVEEEFCLVGFAQEIVDSRETFFHRFIHYPGDRNIEEVTATAHIDQSGFTPHWFQTAPGLQCLTFDGKWIDMPVSEGETVIINSTQMQLRSKGLLKALCHRVVANEQTAKDGRDSAVCFVQFRNTAKYDKVRCGRLQDKLEGFNYNLTPEEFEQFFKK